jgi:hypothetical protein
MRLNSRKFEPNLYTGVVLDNPFSIISGPFPKETLDHPDDMPML